MKESGRNIVHFFLRTLVILFLLALSGLVFVVSSDYPDFTVQARQFAFWSLMPWLNLLALTIVLFDKSFRFILTDALVVAFSIYVAIHFQLKESVTEGRLITFLLLINLYYILRVFQSFWRQTRRWALLSVCLAGIIQAIIGLKQIYGYSFSYHSLYAITGTFFNPGPYGGYMAVIFCVSSAYLIRQYRSFRNNNIRNGDINSWGLYALYPLFGLAATLSFVVLPSTLSRSAWMAVIVTAGVLAIREIPWSLKYQTLYSRNRKRLLIIGLTVFVLITAGFTGIYHLKKHSADGRLLAWKVTANAISKTPFTGVGTGFFGGAYADSQSDLYENEKLSPSEIQVADCPAYAFNEYVQIGAEQGLIGLFLFLSIIVSCLRKKNPDGAEWQYGLCALLVFALTSYPFRILPLQLLLVFSVGFGVHGTKSILPVGNRMGMGLILLILGAGSGTAFNRLPAWKSAYREWKNEQMFYRMELYDGLEEIYAKNAEILVGEPTFLFEYGHIMNKTGKYEDSNSILFQGSKQSSDPMFHNIIGNNYKALAQYDMSAESYRRSFSILPNRLYPLYLSAKLYMESDDTLSTVSYARRVVEFVPKVESPATREMKKEIESLLNILGDAQPEKTD